MATNATVIGLAILFLSLSPATIPAPGSLAIESALALTAGITAMLVANLFLLRRALDPLRKLTELMRHVDPLTPGERVPVYGPDSLPLRRYRRGFRGRRRVPRRSGHTPVLFAGTEVVEFSPIEELGQTMEVVTKNMQDTT
ncbi:MAG TPA: hypothetical protein VFD31_10525 [Thermoleophilaceae bacterium]|nr:hypothetical protein [Thermoleophilaceae bacterium]